MKKGYELLFLDKETNPEKPSALLKVEHLAVKEMGSWVDVSGWVPGLPFV